jgi:arsenite methyltransferase
VQASLGCGVPTAVADLHPGETVLDLGSGAGADVLISARRVGDAGRAIGLDMTDEMLAVARANPSAAGVPNAEFVKGYIEAIPLPDASVDMDAATRADMAAWTGCIAGALTEDEFRTALAAAGLADIEIRETHRVHAHAGSAIVRARKP